MVARGDGDEFEFVAAPGDLRDYVNSLYSWRTAEIVFEDVLPAYSGQLVLFVQGAGTMRFHDGRQAQSDGGFILAPLLQAQTFRVSGPALMFGVSLNFRGWAALTGLAVDVCHDRVLPLDAALPAALAAQVAALAPAWRAGAIDEGKVLEALAQVVREGLTPLGERPRLVIDRTLEWLSGSFSPDVAELYAALPYSERQAQRLVARFFGQPPLRLARRYRAVRAATLLAQGGLTAELEADIREAFYDQAHLVREIRRFTGRTPRGLRPAQRSAVNDTLGAGGYSAVDLFGGNEARQLGRDPD